MIGIPNGMSNSILSSVHRVDNRMAVVNHQLTTGKRDLNAAEEGMVTRLNADIAGFSTAGDNITKTRNVIDVAQTALSSVADILSEMKNLASQASDGTTSAGDKDKLHETFNALLSQIDDLVSSAEIDGVNLVKSGASDIDTQVGLASTDVFTIGAQASDTASLSIDALDISSTGDASAAIDALETAIGTISASQSSLSANDIGLKSRHDTISSIAENLDETVSGIEDADLEALQVELTQLQVQKSIDYYLLGVMNQQAQGVLSIMR